MKNIIIYHLRWDNFNQNFNLFLKNISYIRYIKKFQYLFEIQIIDERGISYQENIRIYIKIDRLIYYRDIGIIQEIIN